MPTLTDLPYALRTGVPSPSAKGPAVQKLCKGGCGKPLRRSTSNNAPVWHSELCRVAYYRYGTCVMPEHICVVCGKAFTPKRRGAKYCSEAHRIQGSTENRRQATGAKRRVVASYLQVEPVYVIDAEGVSHKVCAYDRCGKPNPRERSPFCSKNHQMRAYNQTEDRRERTKEYNAATRGQWVKRAVCQFCTVEFDDPTYERTTCDDVICKSRALRGEWPYTLLPLALRCTVVPFDHPGRTVQCAASDCTADFQRPNVYTLYCTNACKRRAARSRYAEAWGIDALRARENAKGKRRKARRRLRVFDRDGWTCQLCGGEVDAFADMLDDLAPEADHIIPEAHGGSDDYSNLQCAHRICNREKGDQTGWKSPVRREPNSFVA